MRPALSDDARRADLFARVDAVIARIDRVVSRQLDVIRNHADFRALEARWRGLRLLVDRSDPGQGVIIKVLDVDWPTLARGLERAADFDQSHLYRLVHEGEFGMPGGQPFGLLVGDYQLSHRTDGGAADTVDALRRLAAVAASAFCPLIAAAGSPTFGLASFDDLAPYTGIEPAHLIQREQPDFARWQALRRGEDTRFVGLVAPDLLLVRRDDPYHPRPFVQRDAVAGTLPCNGAFGFALTVIDAFLSSGWFAAIRGAYQDEPGGGRVAGLNPVDPGTDRHGLSAQGPVRLRLSSEQEEALCEHGIIPLSHLHLDTDPVFNMLPSLHIPKRYDRPIATQNARLAAMLHYVLCTSRFAHYLKVIMRDEIGSLADPGTIQADLEAWLRGYCLGNDDAGNELKAQYPLRDAGVAVTPIPGRPGTYNCTIRLQPHFQLDDVSTSFHLVTDSSGTASREGLVA
ncbi:type VI secretion system contractile sheath large subunit [Ruegeria jejuensis]|uniref:type VI secretion system contractile sheath large subunit n=1 Tax=Ruegeria jejuensis TaxID=3233338 RepID=UPI00355BDD8C